eukprot:Hpha_TRINITY_DN16042_c0_g7::TRINITY_DN16042_c0_g7_i1::g.118362::m.118362
MGNCGSGGGSRPSGSHPSAATGAKRKSAAAPQSRQPSIFNPGTRGSIKPSDTEVAEKVVGLLSSYKLLSILGKGEFGNVYRGEHKFTGDVRAVKLMHKDPGNPVTTAQLLSESYVGRIPTHPNLVQQHDFFDSPNAAAIVYQMCIGGEVAYSLGDRPQYTESTVCVVIKSLVRGLAHLHSMNLAHMDVKPQNMLFHRPLDPSVPLAVDQIKLADYGSLTPFDPKEPKITKPAGTPHFASPEVVGHVCAMLAGGPNDSLLTTPEAVVMPPPFDERCDVFSAGIVAFVLLLGVHPYVPANMNPKSDSLPNFFNRVLKNKMTLPARFNLLSPEAKELLHVTMRSDFRLRPRAKELLECRWIASVGENELECSIISPTASKFDIESPSPVARTDTVAVNPDILPLQSLAAQLKSTPSQRRLINLNGAEAKQTVEQATCADFHADLREFCSFASTKGKEIRAAMSGLSESSGLRKTVSEVAALEWKRSSFHSGPSSGPGSKLPRKVAGKPLGMLPNIKAVPEVQSEVCSLPEDREEVEDFGSHGCH